MQRIVRTLFTATAIVALVFGALNIATAALTGAIFTTDTTGTPVNQNIYNFRIDVYLNGGPQNQNSAGLPDGFYFFQVTDPNGNVLLSQDDANCRQLQVVGGVVSGAVPSPSFPSTCLHANGGFNPANGSTTVQLAPFDFTPNAGGEYKVWLIAQTDSTSIDPDDSKRLVFSNPDSKTDNFKVLESASCPNPPTCLLPLLPHISGAKFYDANVNGTQDASEPGIPGWQIVLFGASSNNTTTALTNTAGGYSFLNLASGTYGVCEMLPSNATPVWVPTTPTSIGGLVVPPDRENNNFGNVCLGTGGGLTLGFWSNKNGQALLQGKDPAWRTLLTSLNLRNATGANYDVSTSTAFSTTYSSFRSWILGATATNMAYMLSAQLATMELNVLAEKVDGSSILFAGAAPAGCTVPGLSATGFISVSDLMSAANSGANYSLLSYSNTTASGTARNCQQFMKNALDSANNNRNFVQATPCDVNYSGLELSCAP